MNNKIIFLFLLVLIIPTTVNSQSGDVAFWLPDAASSSISEAQVKKNKEYFSIKLHSVFAYYKSGFLENIKKLIVVSETTVSEENKPTVQSTMINKLWQQLDNNGDFIGVNDHLVVLSPATISNLKIKIAFRGIGEDKFGFLFQALSDSSLKATLSFSPATSSIITAITPTIQKLLASPYTSDDPRQILDISQSYVVYADTKQIKVDSLREGYLVIVSSRENKSADLGKILSLESKDIRLSSSGHGLEFKEGNDWKRFLNNSYVVLSVTKTPIRGENEYSNWFSKYIDAERVAEEKLLLASEPFEKVEKEAIALWADGNALLYDDPNYIQLERISIKSKHLNDIQSALYAKGGGTKTKLDPIALGVPSNFSKVARNYEADVQKQSSKITIRTEEESGNPSAYKKLRITSITASGLGSKVKTTNEKGEFALGLTPGIYKIESEGKPEDVKGVFVVDPKSMMALEFKENKKLH